MTIPDNHVRWQLRLGEDSRWEFKQIEFRRHHHQPTQGRSSGRTGRLRQRKRRHHVVRGG